MKNKWIIIGLLLFTPFGVIGQFANAIHYTVKDGLPSSTAYTATQDARGFMWIGTEAGLVRFDGAQFKVFTTQDGLPDNEVLGLIFDDITQRLWIITYSKQACYYRNGIFYTEKNDSSLHLIKCEFGEFVNGNKQEGKGVFLFNGGAIYECCNDKIIKTQLRIAPLFQVHRWTDSTFDFLCDSGALGYKAGEKYFSYEGFDRTQFQNNGKWIDDVLYRYMPGRVTINKRMPNGNYEVTRDIDLHTKRVVTRIIKIRHKLYICVAMEGLFVADDASEEEPRRVWGGNVNDINTDRDENLWITTNDDGLFVVKNTSLQSYNVDNTLLKNNVTALHIEKDGTLYIGNSTGELFSMKDFDLKPLAIRSINNQEKIRGVTLYGDRLFCITNYSIMYYDFRTKVIKAFPHSSGGPKSFLLYNNDQTMLVGLLGSLMTIDTRTDSFWENQTLHKRFIDITRHPDGRVICGSLDGIYEYTPSHSLIQLDNSDPRLNGRITSLCFTADSLLWIGTPANGILVFDGKRILDNITPSTHLGYHGTICRKIVKGRSHDIWVATNAGVDKITYHLSDSLIIDNITPLNTTDGLLSDDVNDIQVQDSLIYLGTSNGLTVLNENRMLNVSAIPVYITAIHINDKDSAIHESEYNLSYLQNNLRIEYVGVSLPSARYLRYQYRLLGSGNDKWTMTSNTSVDLRSLSPGDYTFEATVLDKFGNKSPRIARVHFRITPAFYTTWWFMAAVVIVVLTAGFYIIRARFRRQQRQFEREQSLNNKIIELEQQALKAQMNPHFIFNCLTAVQHFVNKEDLYSANMYLSNFAKLIRKTLDLSGEQYISLDREVDYLENYVHMEKMRFQDKFQYEINVDPEIDEYNAEIPPMLLQPIIENAIRHGLRNMATDSGMLVITFKQDGDKIVCTIDDNGIGRERSKELKTTMHVEYQSKGMSLTEKRIQAINQVSDKKISIEVKDKYDDNMKPIGTLFTLTFDQETKP